MRKDEVVPEGTGTAREIDRRTVAKGVAWTVPAVIVATAAPAAATSGMTVSPALSRVAMDTHPSDAPSFYFSVSCPSNEAGEIEFLTLTYGSTSAPLVLVRALVSGTNNLEASVDMPAVPSPGQAVTIAYKVYDADRVLRGQGSLLGMVAPYSTVTGASQSNNGSTRTITFAIGSRNAKSALEISSVKDANDTNWTQISQTSWEDIGTGTVSFTARRPGNGASARVLGTIDGQPFDVTALA
jgi:hypothetical protein